MPTTRNEQNPRAKHPNSGSSAPRRDERTVTVRLHAPWDPETSNRLYSACRTQDACWNLALNWLIKHPREPLRKSNHLGIKGLQGRWIEWREAHPWAKNVPQTVWRGGVLRAHQQIARWDGVNEAHGRAVVRALEENVEIPRRVQRRNPNPSKLYRRRKQRDRSRSNTCLITEGVKRIDAHTLHIRGVGPIPVRENLPENFKPRSCTIVERTSVDRARRCGRGMKGHERTFDIHVQVRIPHNTGEGNNRLAAVGIDHGIVHPMTTFDTEGNVHHYHHREAKLAALDERAKTIQKTLRNCRRGSREWRRRQGQIKSLRSGAANIRSHTRRRWATELSTTYGKVCVERMDAARLKLSARGTHEAHGSLVNVQREISRRLSNVAPGEQRAELKAACERHGSTYIETPARNSSEYCPECGHCSSDNRKSQAKFRCVECGHTDNADANAARNHLAWGTSAKHRAGVRRSWETTPKRQAGGENPGTGTKANRGSIAERRRNLEPGPTLPPERGSPRGVTTEHSEGAPEAAEIPDFWN